MEEEGGEIGVGETVDKHGVGIDKCTKVEGRGSGTEKIRKISGVGGGGCWRQFSRSWLLWGGGISGA